MGHKNQSVYAVSGTSRCLFSHEYKTHKYSVGRAYSWILNCWCITWPVGFKRFLFLEQHRLLPPGNIRLNNGNFSEDLTVSSESKLNAASFFEKLLTFHSTTRCHISCNRNFHLLLYLQEGAIFTLVWASSIENAHHIIPWITFLMLFSHSRLNFLIFLHCQSPLLNLSHYLLSSEILVKKFIEFLIFLCMPRVPA